VVGGQGDLLQVVAALHACGRLPYLLYGGEEEADEDGDDGNHHQQLDQGKAGPAGRAALRGDLHNTPPSLDYSGRKRFGVMSEAEPLVTQRFGRRASRSSVTWAASVGRAPGRPPANSCNSRQASGQPMSSSNATARIERKLCGLVRSFLSNN